MSTLLPMWMSFLIVFTYLTLIVLVSAGLQRLLYSLPEGHRPAAMSWGLSMYLTVWLSAVVVLSIQGFFAPDATGRVPRISYSLIPFALGGALLLSPVFRKLIAQSPTHWLIGVQTNRLLGVLFLVVYAQGRLPAAFAFPAGFGDLLVGLSAPVVAYLFAARHRQARWIGVLWNAIGMIDLLVAVATGLLTSPGPLEHLAFDAPNLLMGAFPFVIIPAFGVPVWLLLHLYSLRGLTLTNERK